MADALTVNKAPATDPGLAASAPASDLIKNIAATESGLIDQNILGDAPELDRSLIRDIEPPKSIFLLILKILFGLIFVAGAVSIIFFTSQFSTTFDLISNKFDLPNVSKELSSTNSQVIALQTDANFYRYLKIKGNLDKFSFDGDSYLQNYEIASSQTANETEKQDAKTAMEKVKSDLKTGFLASREDFAKNFSATLIDINYQDASQLDTLYQEKLKIALNEKANVLANAQDLQSKKDYRNYIQAVSLINNSTLKALLIQTDFDKLDDKQLYDFVRKVDKLVVNDLSTIQEIKSKRVRWSEVMNELALRTMAVDSHYNENFYNDLGGIRYTSYEFDSGNRKISIVGETKKFDTTNFTMIANLIDELNKSGLFESAEMRSFSKSGSLTDGYTAQLKMAFNLESEVKK